MSLIRNGNIVDDAWIRLGDETPAPVGVRAIVSLKRWREDRQSLLSALAGIGVLLRSNETAEDIADDLDIIEVVALDFPSFTDGRHYSTARILRERYRFFGEVRAVGDVLRDQYAFMTRCGFDAFELPRADETAWLEAIAEIQTSYQPAADGRSPIFRLRAETPQDVWLAY